MGSIESLRKLN